MQEPLFSFVIQEAFILLRIYYLKSKVYLFKKSSKKFLNKMILIYVAQIMKMKKNY